MRRVKAHVRSEEKQRREAERRAAEFHSEEKRKQRAQGYAQKQKEREARREVVMRKCTWWEEGPLGRGVFQDEMWRDDDRM